MKIHLKVMGPLIYKAGFSVKDFDLDSAITIKALIDKIGIPMEFPRIVTRNGAAVLPEELIKDGDTIAVSPIYSGG